MMLMRYSSLLVFWVNRALNEPDGSFLRKSSPFGPGILFSRSKARYPGPALATTESNKASSDVAAAKERIMINGRSMARLLRKLEDQAMREVDIGSDGSTFERDNGIKAQSPDGFVKGMKRNAEE